MSRSPLVSLIKSLVRSVQHDGHAPLGGSRSSPGGLTRRQALQQACASALLGIGAASLGGCSPRQRRQDVPVAIIGGGLAGLTCAWMLLQRGYRVQVYEGSQRGGGRVFTDRTTFAPIDCELGGEFIDSDHVTMHHLARIFDIPLIDFGQDTLKCEKFTAFIGGRRYGFSQLVEPFRPIGQAVTDALASLGSISQELVFSRPQAGIELDRLSISQWLDSIKAGGPIRVLLEKAYTEEYGLDPEHSSALNLLLSLGPNNTSFDIVGDSDERYHAQGGNVRFVEELSRHLSPGQLHYGHRLESVGTTSGGRYRLGFASGAESRSVDVEHVVFALPFTVLRQIDLRIELPSRKRQAIHELGYGVNTKLCCETASNLWRANGSNGVIYTDRAFQSSWDAGRLQSGATGVLTSFTGGRQAQAMAQGPMLPHAKHFLSDFDQVIPGTAAQATGRAVRIGWHQQPLALGSYAAYLPGQYSTIAGSEGGRVGNLHFCGEHTSLMFQGYMEGAAASGMAVALELRDDFEGRQAAASAAHA